MMKYLVLFLISFASGFIVSLAVVFLIKLATGGIAKKKKDMVKEDISDDSLGLGTQLMLGAMGAELLDRSIEEHKRESKRKERELFYWQDAIRDEMRQDESYIDDDLI